MARYIIRESTIDVLGKLWMPNINASMHYVLRAYDVENMRDDDGAITRESVEQWLAANAGDFSQIIDFTASIEDGDATIDIPFSSEDNECAYMDTLASFDDEE